MASLGKTSAGKTNIEPNLPKCITCFRLVTKKTFSAARPTEPGPEYQPMAENEVLDLYQRFKRENPDSKITPAIFQQIWKTRQEELNRRPAVLDIPLDQTVLYKSDSEHTERTEKDNARVECWRRHKKSENDRLFAKLLARLHEKLETSFQESLRCLCSSAMHPTVPTLSMKDFANKIMDLCREHVVNEEDSLEIELELREYFANLLALPIDSFGSG